MVNSKITKTNDNNNDTASEPEGYPPKQIQCVAHATQNLKRLLCNVRTAAYVAIQLVPKCHYITWLNMHDQPLNLNVNNALNNWWSI